jgi:hypothetical protein
MFASSAFLNKAGQAISTRRDRSDRLPGVRFYGLLDRDHAEVIEFYPSLQGAELALREILGDEPDWAGRFEVVLVDFSGAEPAVIPAS